MTRKELLRAFRFRLEVDGVPLAGFKEVLIGGATIDAVARRGGTAPRHAMKISGLTKLGNVTLKGGVTDSPELSAWHQRIATGGAKEGRKVVIVVADENGTDTAQYAVKNAWPAKYQAADLHANGNEVAIESLELANEGIEPAS